MTDKKVFQDGVYDIPNREYHASSGFSRSQLHLLNKSPYHFWYSVLSGKAEKKEATPAMKAGSLFHTLVLEPEKLSDEFYVISQKTMPTQGTNPYNMIVESANGREPITQSQLDKAMKMADAVRQFDIVQTLIEGAQFEQSIYWTDKETGLQFKARPDIWSPTMVIDLKTCEDSSLKSMQSSCIKYGYTAQAGMIYEACKSINKPIEMFVILACEKEEPFCPSVFIMSNELLQRGIDEFRTYKIKLKDCIDHNKWEGYQVNELSLPSWLKDKDI